MSDGRRAMGAGRGVRDRIGIAIDDSKRATTLGGRIVSDDGQRAERALTRQVAVNSVYGGTEETLVAIIERTCPRLTGIPDRQRRASPGTC